MAKKDAQLFIGFYVLSTLMYYTASWISYGAFSPGHPSFFDLEEFFSAAGVQFAISFLLTLPICYLVFIFLKHPSFKTIILVHSICLPIHIVCTYFGLFYTKLFFGWAMNWGGYSTVWTFYFLLLFYLVQFAFMHAYSYFNRFKKEEKEKFILREAALQSQIIALKSQLNPHFLHNLLNSINATIPPENEGTRELIVKLSDLFRYQNYASQNEYVTLKEELEFLENYLALMKIRLKERLTYHFDVPSEVDNVKIVPMLLQPLIENAVIHAISPKIVPSTLTIKVEKSEGKLCFSIQDTGLGIQDKSAVLGLGLGLSTTKLRLDKIYGAELRIEDNAPTGTKISFSI